MSSGYDSSGSTGSCKCNNAEIGGGQPYVSAASTSSNTARNRRLGAGGSADGEAHDMESVLRDGRVQALVEGLWIKVVCCHVIVNCHLTASCFAYSFCALMTVHSLLMQFCRTTLR